MFLLAALVPRVYFSFLVSALLLPTLKNELECGVRQQKFKLSFQYL